MADLMRALRNADAAGDTEAAKRIAAMIREQRSSGASTQQSAQESMQQPAQSKSEIPSQSEQQSMPSVTQGQMWPTPKQAPQQEPQGMGEFESTKELPELSGSGILSGLDKTKAAAITPALLTATDPNEIAQILTSTYPEEITTTYEKAPNGTVYPVLRNRKTGAATPINREGLSGMDVLQGLATAAAFTPAARAGSLAGAAIRSGLTSAGVESAQEASGGQFDPSQVALDTGLGAAGKGIENIASSIYRGARGSIPEAQKEVIERGAQEGVPVMTSDVIPPETLAGKLARSSGEKIPFVGTGQARAAQQEARESAVSSFVEKYQEPSYEAVVDSLKRKKSSTLKSAGNVIGNAGRKLDEAGDIPVDNAISSIDDAIEELSKPNVRRDDAAIAELEELKKILDTPQTFTSLKENRTITRDIIDSFGKGERSQLPKRSTALLKKALSGMSKDMDSFAKNNLSPQEYTKWKRANAVYGEEAEKLKKSGIKNILDKGDIRPEVANNMLFSKDRSQIKTLYNSLDTKGKDNARAALISRAYENASRRAGGISPSSFSSELNKISKNTDVFFKGEEKKQLEGFKRLMESTRRAQEAAVETPTGQQLLGATLGAGAIFDLASTASATATIAGLSRVYESPIVRNALLRLASVPKGSDKYLRALEEAQAAITTASQSVARKENE